MLHLCTITTADESPQQHNNSLAPVMGRNLAARPGPVTHLGVARYLADYEARCWFLGRCVMYLCPPLHMQWEGGTLDEEMTPCCLGCVNTLGPRIWCKMNKICYISWHYFHTGLGAICLCINRCVCEFIHGVRPGYMQMVGKSNLFLKRRTCFICMKKLVLARSWSHSWGRERAAWPIAGKGGCVNGLDLFNT